MFGLKIRSWMETHLVRSRKKRNKDGTKIKQDKSPPDHITVVNNEFEYKSAKSIDKQISPVSTIKTQATDHSSSSLLKKQSPFTCTVNLSSPESAYSTGYSTDGTSPGTSLPPEYYINIRSGTHYIQSNQNNNSENNYIEKLTPRSARRRKEEAKRKKYIENSVINKNLPESSTEDEILNGDNTTAERRISHVRTESYDEKNVKNLTASSVASASNVVPPSPVPSSPIPSSPVPYQCSSPYLPGASPRPRNRIRTNPWLPSSPNGGPNKSFHNDGTGDISAIDSCSTVSSYSIKEKHASPSKKMSSPRNKPMSFNDDQKCSQSMNKRNNCKDNAVTSCSPLSKHCSQIIRQSSRNFDSSSSPLSSSDDDQHGNTSDFSDDDVTLNEMLGKYDESYTYEKETDILSDSDLTDMEDEKNININFFRRDNIREDFDFIDNGSIVQSENNSPMPGKRSNTGHCYYHLAGERLMKQSVNNSRSSSRGSSVVKRSKKSDSERRKKVKTYSQEKLQGSQMKINQPNAKIEKGLNVNKLLVDRLNYQTQRDTRSANTTPISTRKKLSENGKYLKNDYITNLINSNINLSEKNRSSNETLNNNRKYSLDNNLGGSGSLQELQQKKRSHSFSQDIPTESEDLKYKKLTEEANIFIEKLEKSKLIVSSRKSLSAQNSPSRLKPSSEYKRTFHESANHTSPNKYLQHNSDSETKNLQTFNPNIKCMSPLKLKLLNKQNCMDKKNYHNNNNINNYSPIELNSIQNKHTQPTEIDSVLPYQNKKYNSQFITSKICQNDRNINNRNDVLIRETIDYTVPYHHISKNQTMIDCLSDDNSMIISSTNNFHNYYGEKPSYENIQMTTFSRQYTPTQYPLVKRISNAELTENVPINIQSYKRVPKESNELSSNQFKPMSTFQNPYHHTRSTVDILSESKQKSLLLSFKSLDLGGRRSVNEPESKGYCPRSEPVKRKVYPCSSSHGKLQKSLRGGNSFRNTESYSNQLRNSVVQLRKERFYVEAKLRKTQQQINKIKHES